MQLSGLVIAGIGGAVSIGGTIWHMRVRSRNMAIKDDDDKVLTVADRSSEMAANALAGLGAAILVFGAMLSNGRNAVLLVPSSIATLGMTYLAFVNPTDLKAKVTVKVITVTVSFFAAMTFATNLARTTGLSVDTASVLVAVGVVTTTALPFLPEIRGVYRKLFNKEDKAAEADS